MGIINRNKKNGRFATKKSIEGNAKRVAKMRQHVDFSVSPVIAPLLPDNPVSGDESLITVSPESDINIGHPVTPAASNNSIIPDSKTPIVHSKSPSSPVPVSTVWYTPNHVCCIFIRRFSGEAGKWGSGKVEKRRNGKLEKW